MWIVLNVTTTEISRAYVELLFTPQANLLVNGSRARDKGELRPDIFSQFPYFVNGLLNVTG